MKHTHILLLSTVLLAAQASAQTNTPPTQIVETLVDTMTQEGSVTFISDFGFPDGQIPATVDLDCLAGTSHVDAYKIDALGDYGTNPDADALATITASKVMKLSQTEVNIPSIAGTLRMYCKDKVLYTDFSGAFGKGAQAGQHQLGKGNIAVKQSSAGDTVIFDVPSPANSAKATASWTPSQ